MRRARNGVGHVGLPIPWPDPLPPPTCRTDPAATVILLSRHNGIFPCAPSRRPFGSRRRVAGPSGKAKRAFKPPMSAAMMAMPVLCVMMMTVNPMTPPRAATHGQPTFGGDVPNLRLHTGRGSRHVGNDISTKAHRIRGAGLARRVALCDRTVRATGQRTGQQSKRASQMNNTHVVTPILRVMQRTVATMTDDRGHVGLPDFSTRKPRCMPPAARPTPAGQKVAKVRSCHWNPA